MNLKKKNNFIIGLILVIIIIFLTNFYFDEKNKAQDKTTVGKVYNQKQIVSSAPGIIIDYYFYVDGKKIKGNTKVGTDLSLHTENKLFTVKYESNNPKNSSILLNHQIINESLIRKAGF